MQHRRAALALLGVLSIGIGGCNASLPALGGALVSATVAVAAAAVRRATGACFTTCDGGYRCEPGSGLCVLVPCGASCGEAERCDERAGRCVPVAEPPSPASALSSLGASVPAAPGAAWVPPLPSSNAPRRTATLRMRLDPAASN